MGWFSKAKEEPTETKEEEVHRIMKEKAGKYFMALRGVDIDMERDHLDLFYENGWELVASSSRYLGNTVWYFKRMRGMKDE